MRNKNFSIKIDTPASFILPKKPATLLKNVLGKETGDVIITATGVYTLLKEDMIKEGAVIIDCGIIKKNNRLHGDCDFENLKNKASIITPVPNGVGPITTAMVIKNLIELYNKR